MQSYFLFFIERHIMNNTGCLSSHKHSNALQLKYTRRSSQSLILKIKQKHANFAVKFNPMAKNSTQAWSDNKYRAEPFQSFLHLHKKDVFRLKQNMPARQHMPPHKSIFLFTKSFWTSSLVSIITPRKLRAHLTIFGHMA